ncbi:DnaJ domain-containing protein [Leptodesmis sichuanensis]|uniref:DnaJ domain-containing protein n=1 Tax=Leptodesmis sichuanensis TaxID=2906798 RepID=UPI001F26B623|nr:DnaJ domain-containing protein [Leptodesmis sichuanensis]UIE36108.1 DnaJ domain-containing protein [Leptodesmis sichuanensis A121]
MAAKKQSKATQKTVEKKEVLNDFVLNEISRLSELHGVNASVFEEFAKFVVENYKRKPPKPPKPLTQTQIKQAIYTHFGVTTTPLLKKSARFQMATSAMNGLDLGKKDGWEKLYRKFVGILPEEENEQGRGCINGINIFKYDMPWRTFGLDPKKSTTEDIKSRYYQLSKIYHPDNKETGDAEVFDRLTLFYKSLTEKF